MTNGRPHDKTFFVGAQSWVLTASQRQNRRLIWLIKNITIVSKTVVANEIGTQFM